MVRVRVGAESRGWLGLGLQWSEPQTGDVEWRSCCGQLLGQTQ